MKLLLSIPGGSEWIIIITFLVVLGGIISTFRKRTKDIAITEIKIEHNNQTSVPPINITEDIFNQLEKIGRLKDIGILSKEEFEAEKRKILS